MYLLVAILWLHSVSLCVPLSRDSFCSFLFIIQAPSNLVVEAGKYSLVGALQDSWGASAWGDHGGCWWGLPGQGPFL